MMTRILELAFRLAWKDLRMEFRSRQNFLTVLFFAFIVIVIFNFAFEPGSPAIRESAPAILWVAFLFAGILNLSSAFIVEKEEGCLLGLLLAPMERGVIFIGKFLSNMMFQLLMELLIFPVFLVFFNIELRGGWLWFLLVVILVNTGFVAVGTLFSAMTIGLKTREVLLPILLFPVIVPVIIAGVRATGLVFQGSPGSDLGSWLKLLGGFDLVFVVVSAAVFRFVVEEAS